MLPAFLPGGLGRKQGKGRRGEGGGGGRKQEGNEKEGGGRDEREESAQFAPLSQKQTF